jgi:hypothetical protein
MAIRYPLEYEVTPRHVDGGEKWLSLRLKNVGDEPLTALDVRLNSLDVYSLSVSGAGDYLSELQPGAEAFMHFQVMANSTGSLYVSIDGWRGGSIFHWETPAISITVGREMAELMTFFAMTEPYPLLGDKIDCEATVHGLEATDNVTLEFWVENPSDEFEAFHTIETGPLSAGEIERYSAEFTPTEEGLYTVYAYLFDDGRRIGRQIDYVSVREAAV